MIKNVKDLGKKRTTPPEFPSKEYLAEFHARYINNFIYEFDEDLKSYEETGNSEGYGIIDFYVVIGWSYCIIDLMPRLDIEPRPYIKRLNEKQVKFDDFIRKDKNNIDIVLEEIRELYSDFYIHHDLFYIEDVKISYEGLNFVPFYHLYLDKLWTWDFVLRGMTEMEHKELIDGLDEYVYLFNLNQKELKTVFEDIILSYCIVGKEFRHPDYYPGDFWYWKEAFKIYQEYKNNKRKII